MNGILALAGIITSILLPVIYCLYIYLFGED